jgi:hypothetical protein
MHAYRYIANHWDTKAKEASCQSNVWSGPRVWDRYRRRDIASKLHLLSKLRVLGWFIPSISNLFSNKSEYAWLTGDVCDYKALAVTKGIKIRTEDQWRLHVRCDQMLSYERELPKRKWNISASQGREYLSTLIHLHPHLTTFVSSIRIT